MGTLAIVLADTASQKTSLSQLVVDLIAAVGTSRDWISRVTVFQGFAVIERGPATWLTQPIGNWPILR